MKMLRYYLLKMTNNKPIDSSKIQEAKKKYNIQENTEKIQKNNIPKHI
jgi:hypothetical protein